MQLWGANTLKNNKRIEVLATSTYLVAKMPWRDVLSILRANVIECLRMIKYQMAVGFCTTHVKKKTFLWNILHNWFQLSRNSVKSFLDLSEKFTYISFIVKAKDRYFLSLAIFVALATRGKIAACTCLAQKAVTMS